MAFSPLATYVSSIKISTTSYSFDKWEDAQDCSLAEVTNLTSGGFAQYIDGISSCKIKLSGPLDNGNMVAFTIGSAISLIIEFVTGTSVTVTGLVKSCTVSGDIKDAQRIAIEFWATDTFDLLPI